MTNEKHQYPITIGSIVGGVTRPARSWRELIVDMSLRAKEAGVDRESPLRVNLVFHVGGEVSEPEFEGVRTGRYWKEDCVLMVQIAIPQMPVPPDAKSYLLSRMQEAVTAAEDYGRRRGLTDGSLEEIRSILAEAVE
jgi:hypothetical protein